LTLAEAQERLVAWASADPRQGWILAARREHFARHGEPHEEDPSYEARMNGLLDFFAFDYRPDGASTTLELFLRDGAGDIGAEDRAALVDLSLGVHALFEVRRLRPGEIRVRDVFSGEEHDVSERRAAAGLEKGDLIEARLLPWGGRLHFSAAFLFHPRPLRKRILGEVKRRVKAAGKGGKPDAVEFLALLARMELRLERYRNARPESIYDFDAPAPPIRSGPWE
jgi:hypothetical protein